MATKSKFEILYSQDGEIEKLMVQIIKSLIDETAGSSTPKKISINNRSSSSTAKKRKNNVRSKPKKKKKKT